MGSDDVGRYERMSECLCCASQKEEDPVGDEERFVISGHKYNQIRNTHENKILEEKK